MITFQKVQTFQVFIQALTEPRLPEVKTQSYVRAHQMSFSAIFLLNKIMVLIFQIIHIRNKTLNPWVNGGFERWHQVLTRLHDPFTFWHERQREKNPQKLGCIRSELDERKFG